MIDGSNIRISAINTVMSVHSLCFVQMPCSELEFHPDQFEDAWGTLSSDVSMFVDN